MHREIWKNSEILLSTCFLLVSCLDYLLTLKTETIRPSETPISFYRNTQQYILFNFEIIYSFAHQFFKIY
jgi:hypothetical protein